MYVPVPQRGCGGPEPSRAIIRRLLAEGATSEWSARPLEPRNKLEARRLERTLRDGIVHQTSKGTYWVDQERWERCRARQLRIVGVAVLAVLLMFAILFVLGEFP